MLAACGGSNADTGDGGVNDDSRLPDNEPCAPGALRCNGNEAQQCNEEGTMWVTQETCSTFCEEGVCAIDGLDVTSDMSLDGPVVVAGDVFVRAGATLSSPTGNLTIFAQNITVEAGGSVAAAPTGAVLEGKGSDGSSSFPPNGGFYVGRYGSDTDAEVQAGAEGGKQFGAQTPVAKGGGVIKLLAKGTFVMAGTITANGQNGGSDNNVCTFGGGGGSGGGVLIVGDDLQFTGSISAAGGLGGVNTCQGNGRNGGEGRVKTLFGSARTMTGTVVGRRTEGMAPPIPMKSLTHPDPTKVYNDGFLSFDVEWKKAFPSTMGFYVRLDRNRTGAPPTPGDGQFVSIDKISFSPNDIFDGDNFVHVVSVDSQSNVGTVDNVLRVQINTQGPSMSSSSHPSETTFSNNTNPFFQWEYPQGDENVAAVHVKLDQFGDTVPTTADEMLPGTQKQLLKSNVPPGIHVLHVVAVDGQGRLTKQAGHYQVRIGTDPGQGSVQGNIVDSNNQPIVGATVTINRGIFETSTSTNGVFNLGGVTAGTWELSAKFGALSATKTITVINGMSTAGNLTLQ